jgi:hypothetical protein
MIALRRIGASPVWTARSRLFGVLVLMLMLTLSSLAGAGRAAAAAAADPVTCSGYPQKRAFLDAQAWWMRTPGQNGTDFGHVHVGTCFPAAQTISGVVHFDVKLVLHDNPGTLTKLRIQIFNSGAPDPVKLVPLSYTCPPPGTCTWWVPVDIDTRVAYDGCQEFRFQAWVREPDGNDLLATNGWRAVLANGRPASSYCNSDGRGVNYTEGRGWYTNFGYEIGRLDDPFPWAPVSGIWSPKLKTAAGSGGIAPTHHLVCIDPDFHAGNNGIVLVDGPGSWGAARIPIDTTRLANGPHRLVLRTDAATSKGSTLSGVMAIPFTVQN